MKFVAMTPSQKDALEKAVTAAAAVM